MVNQEPNRRGLLMTAGILLGVGLGGLLDGILLHQILQWHHMLTNVRPITNALNVEANTFWDGLFNGSMWLMILLGITCLWNATRPATYFMAPCWLGWLLLTSLKAWSTTTF